VNTSIKFALWLYAFSKSRMNSENGNGIPYSNQLDGSPQKKETMSRGLDIGLETAVNDGVSRSGNRVQSTEAEFKSSPPPAQKFTPPQSGIALPGGTKSVSGVTASSGGEAGGEVRRTAEEDLASDRQGGDSSGRSTFVQASDLAKHSTEESKANKASGSVDPLSINDASHGSTTVPNVPDDSIAPGSKTVVNPLGATKYNPSYGNSDHNVPTVDDSMLQVRQNSADQLDNSRQGVANEANGPAKVRGSKDFNGRAQSSNSLVLVTLHEDSPNAGPGLIAVPLGGKPSAVDPTQIDEESPGERRSSSFCCGGGISKCLFVSLSLILLVLLLSVVAVMAQIEHVTHFSTFGDLSFLAISGIFSYLSVSFVVLTWGLIAVLVNGRILVYIYCLLLFVTLGSQVFLARTVRDTMDGHLQSLLDNWGTLPDAAKRVIQIAGRCCGDLSPMDDPAGGSCPLGTTGGCRHAIFEIVHSCQGVLLRIFSASTLIFIVLCILAVLATRPRRKTSV